RDHVGAGPAIDDRTIITAHRPKVIIHPREIAIRMSDDDKARDSDHDLILVPWQKQPSKRRREILLPASGERGDARPIRSETRATLINAIARGRRWMDELIGNQDATAETIAHREGC